MMTLRSASLQRAGKILLDHADLTIHPGQKVGLIGANGSGKSSLFQLLLGQLHLDGGTLDLPNSWRIAHMAQEIETLDRQALDYVLDGDQALRRIEAALAQAQQQEEHERAAQLFADFEAHNGYSARQRAQELLTGLGFAHDDAQRSVREFSGGWQIRLNLAQALMCPSDLLLLDEPTNHLDLDTVLWLERWLRNYPGTLLLISHDRDFLDGVCDQVAHLDQGKLIQYKGGYTAFERQRSERLIQQQSEFDKQQRRRSELQRFVDRFRAKATKARQAQSRLKMLERMTELAPIHAASPFQFSFRECSACADPMLNLQQVDLGYGQPILRQLNLNLHPGQRIGLLGPNGAGKSTLIKHLSGQLDALAGEQVRASNLKVGYFAQHQLEALDLDASPLLHLQRLSPDAREQTLRDFIGGFAFHGDAQEAPVRGFSGGEKARLALALLVWQRPNLLLLDEPTNHLDLEMREALSLSLQQYEGAVIVVSHDRHLLRASVDQYWLVHNGRVREFDGDLSDYEQWLREQRQNDVVPSSRGDKGSPDRKQARQRSAEIRRQLQPLKKQVNDAERKMEKAHAALAKLEEQLADESLYTDPQQRDRLQQLIKEQATLKGQLEEQELVWLELQDQLESLQQALEEEA